jgi:hypothetical protein
MGGESGGQRNYLIELFHHIPAFLMSEVVERKNGLVAEWNSMQVFDILVACRKAGRTAPVREDFLRSI